MTALSPEAVERLARLSHERYRARLDGDRRAAVPAFDDLAEDDKEANRALVRAWPARLAAAGLELATDAGDRPIVDELPSRVVERMAIAEHARWLRQRADHGYVWGAERRDDTCPPTHPDMVPWRRTGPGPGAAGGLDGVLGPGELGEASRDKDRDKVTEMIPLLRSVGVLVVRAR